MGSDLGLRGAGRALRLATALLDQITWAYTGAVLAESGRAAMEQLLRSWLLELRAAHKSEKTRVAYGDAANQFIAFLADPPAGLDGELAGAIAEAPAIAEMPDLKAVHVRLFMSYLYAAGRKPSTVNNRYRGLQQWFRWLVDEAEIEYSPFANLKPPQV